MTTPNEQSWEEEFDAKLESGAFHNPIDGIISAGRIKNFIRSKLSAERGRICSKINAAISEAAKLPPSSRANVLEFLLDKVEEARTNH